jgi:hypothetical protein
LRYYFDRKQTPRTFDNGARLFLSPFPFANIARVELCPCEDGKIRTVDATGESMSFWQVPASTRVKGKHVSGFLAFDKESGPVFIAYSDKRNGALIVPQKETTP